MKKGFTLIELLAVIIILGILMLIAIPSVTSYINNSRKQTYISTVKNLINGTITKVNSGELDIQTNPELTYYVDPKCICMENTYTSPYGKYLKSYVLVKYSEKNDSFNYYWTGVDEAGYGADVAVPFSKLDEKKLKVNLSEDDLKIKAVNSGSFVMIDGNCNVGTAMEAEEVIVPACGSEAKIIVHSTLDGRPTVYAGEIVTLTAERIGMDDCNYTWEWNYSLDDEDTEYRPIEEVPQLISYDKDTLVYKVNRENVFLVYRYYVRFEDEE